MIDSLSTELGRLIEDELVKGRGLALLSPEMVSRTLPFVFVRIGTDNMFRPWAPPQPYLRAIPYPSQHDLGREDQVRHDGPERSEPCVRNARGAHHSATNRRRDGRNVRAS